jgi:hypothetical protein
VKVLVKVVDVPATDQKCEAVKASQPHKWRINKRSLARIYHAIENLADGTRHEPLWVARHVTLPGIPTNLTGLRALHLIPWLKISRNDDNTATVEIDQELRAICEARAPRPELSGWSYRAWSKNLRKTITQKRKENRDERMRKSWQPENIVLRKQTELLNWIEEELDRLP